MSLPLVSAVIPCRNEAPFIARCLESVIANDYPKDRLEILVVDGMSEDRTREIVRRYADQHPFVALLDNPRRHATAAFNAGIKRARGDVIMIMGAHAAYDPSYISTAVKALQTYGADNVGGVWRVVPRERTLVGEAIAVAVSSGFGAGDAYTKRGSREPRWVETVFGGCYRRTLFDRIGLFDERLARSQDIEFNLRLRRSGGRILLHPGMRCDYFVRTGWREFWQHNVDDGFWTFYPLRFGRRTFVLRHVVPPAFVSSLLLSAGLAPVAPVFGPPFLAVVGAYAAANLAYSVALAARYRRPGFAAVLPLVFAMRHIGYGLGALAGMLGAGISAAMAVPSPLRAKPLYEIPKRVFELTGSALGLAILSPLLLLLAALIHLDSPGPVFYRGQRVGRGGRPFRIFKFRTMVVNAEAIGGPSTADDDPRITRVGRWLRKRKLDELPQLINVLRGEMSIVGPRPEVPQYIALMSPEERALILSVRPGMTDWASLWNIDEGVLLAGSADPERVYLEQIRPQKIRLQLEYVRRRSLVVDLRIILQTLAAIIGRRKARSWAMTSPNP